MEKCNKELEISRLEEHVKTIYKQIGGHDDRLGKIETKASEQYELSKAIALMAQQMGGISKDVTDIKTEVTTVKKDVGSLKDKMQNDKIQDLEKEVTKWDKYKWYVLLSVTGLFLGYFFSMITERGL